MSVYFQRTRLIGLLLISALTLILWVYSRQFQQEHGRPLGLLTATQVIALSDPICRSIAPHTNELRLSAESWRGSHLWWNVSCQDPKGRELAHLEWTPKTAELVQIEVHPDQQEFGRSISMPARKGMERMRYWLSLLRTDVSTGWRPIETPRSDRGKVWACGWISQEVHAYIRVDSHTGDLLIAQFWRSPISKNKKRSDDNKQAI